MSISKAIEILNRMEEARAYPSRWIDDAIRELEMEGKDEAVVGCARCGKPLGKGTLVSFVPLDNQLHVGAKVYCSAECQRSPWVNVKQDGDKGPNGSCPDWTLAEAQIQGYRPKCDWCGDYLPENVYARVCGLKYCSYHCMMDHINHERINDLTAWRDDLMQSIGGKP